MTSLSGCLDTLDRDIPVQRLDVEFFDDRIPICLGETTDLVKSFNPNFTYQWSPSNGLSCTTCPNPKANPDKTTRYTVTVSNGLCSIDKEVEVVVSELLDIMIMNDSVSCNDTVNLSANGGVAGSIEWGD